jgi:DNA-binding Lrp family transcriptional regulator
LYNRCRIGGIVGLKSIERAILRDLYRNCRISFEELGRRNGVSSTTIKKHYTTLKDDGILGDLVIRLCCSSIKANRLLMILKSPNIEKTKELVMEIGENRLVESVGRIDSDRILINAICCNLDQFFELKTFLSRNLNVDQIESHLLRTKTQGNQSLSKLELDILRYLNTHPRMPSHTLANRIGRSAKTVRLAINKLQSTGKVHFSIQPSFHYFFSKIRINHNNNIMKNHRINDELPSVWTVHQSSSDSLFFVTFLPTDISELSFIRQWFDDNDVFDLEYIDVGEPLEYYPSIRKELLLNLF